MSVLDQIRKLDEQKAQLLETAKKESLAKAEAALKELSALGFHYRLVSDDGASIRATGTRRTGIREEVLAAVKATPGITRADLLEKMDAKGNKSAEQSVSNALAALKKAGTITGENGSYTAK